jgi:hypothetical protein
MVWLGAAAPPAESVGEFRGRPHYMVALLSRVLSVEL